LKASNKAHWTYVNGILLEGLENNGTKPFWSYIKARKQDNIGVALLKKNGVLINNSKDKAEILSDQFRSVFTHEEDGAVPELGGQTYRVIDPLTIRDDGVQKLLTRLKPNKASGPDAIPACILKELANEFAPALSAFFTQSLHTGTLPSDWTKAYISPVFKKNSRHLPENYHSVSLTSICCKVMEHIIVKHIACHVDKYNILTQYQYGFRQARSCETQLITTLHDMMYHWDVKVQLDVAVLDFSKAFDTVPHNRLLVKLHHYGTDGNIHHWLSSSLKNRSQSVVVDGESSVQVRVESGVPQGLGPMLFLLHINDLPESGCLPMIACYTVPSTRHLSDQLALQKDLDTLALWCNRWGM